MNVLCLLENVILELVKYWTVWTEPNLYLYTKAEILIDWCLRRRVVQFRVVMSASYDTLREINWVILI